MANLKISGENISGSFVPEVRDGQSISTFTLGNSARKWGGGTFATLTASVIRGDGIGLTIDGDVTTSGDIEIQGDITGGNFTGNTFQGTDLIYTGDVTLGKSCDTTFMLIKSKFTSSCEFSSSGDNNYLSNNVFLGYNCTTGSVHLMSPVTVSCGISSSGDVIAPNITASNITVSGLLTMPGTNREIVFMDGDNTPSGSEMFTFDKETNSSRVQLTLGTKDNQWGIAEGIKSNVSMSGRLIVSGGHDQDAGLIQASEALVVGRKADDGVGSTRFGSGLERGLSIQPLFHQFMHNNVDANRTTNWVIRHGSTFTSDHWRAHDVSWGFSTQGIVFSFGANNSNFITGSNEASGGIFRLVRGTQNHQDQGLMDGKYADNLHMLTVGADLTATASGDWIFTSRPNGTGSYDEVDMKVGNGLYGSDVSGSTMDTNFVVIQHQSKSGSVHASHEFRVGQQQGEITEHAVFTTNELSMAGTAAAPNFGNIALQAGGASALTPMTESFLKTNGTFSVLISSTGIYDIEGTAHEFNIRAAGAVPFSSDRLFAVDSSGSLWASSSYFEGNVTASGDIKAIGDVTASNFNLPLGGQLNFEGSEGNDYIKDTAAGQVDIYTNNIQRLNVMNSSVKVGSNSNPIYFHVRGGGHAGRAIFDGDITASANISASGYVSASIGVFGQLIGEGLTLNASTGIFGTGTTTINDDINTTGNITASGDISSSNIVQGLSGSFQVISGLGPGGGGDDLDIIASDDIRMIPADNLEIRPGNALKSTFFAEGGVRINDNSSAAPFNELHVDGTTQILGEVTASGDISASGIVTVQDLIIDYGALPTSDPSVAGQVYRNGSNQLFVSAG